MRASELLGAPVMDANGQRIGVVHDLRALREAKSTTAGTRGRFRIIALVVGGSGVIERIAHGWGFAEGRTQGPWILRRLTRRSVEAALVVPAELVGSWGPSRVILKAERGELSSLRKGVSHE